MTDSTDQPTTARRRHPARLAAGLFAGLTLTTVAACGAEKVSTTAPQKTTTTTVETPDTEPERPDESTNRSDSDRDYPARARDAFTEGCTSTGAGAAYCLCVLEELEDAYTLQEYIELNVEMLETGNMPDDMVEIAVLCVS